MSIKSRWRLIIATGLAVLACAAAVGQYNPFQSPVPQPTYQQPKTYSDYYTEQLDNYHKPPTNLRNYTIDKYFYHRPTLSPYLNLTRITSPNNLNNYYRYVLPEVERRSQASGLPTPVATAPPPVATPPANPGHVPLTNPYFDKFYNFGGSTVGTLKPTSPLPKLYP